MNDGSTVAKRRIEYKLQLAWLGEKLASRGREPQPEGCTLYAC